MEVYRIIVAASKEAQTIVESLPGANVGATVRRAQYSVARRALLSVAETSWARIGETIEANLLEATRLATAANLEILNVLMTAMPDDFAALERSFLRATERTYQSIQSRVLNSIDLSPNVYRNRALTAGKVDAAVNNGLALGKSAREIADDVRRYINPRVMGGQRYAAFRLGRTELNNAFHSTSLRQYAESPWVEGVKWSLSRSHSRADICDEYAKEDGWDLGPGVFPASDVPFKPHPQDLCYTTPITPEPEEFISRLIRGDYGSF